MENPPKKFFRLVPGGEIRLKSAYIIKCQQVVKDSEGRIIELRCSYDPDSKSGGATAGRKVKGTSHWVSAQHALPAEVRLYDHLFPDENPEEDEGVNFTSKINPRSLEILENCMLEPTLAKAVEGSRYQFMRQGYFCVDPDSTSGRLVFNRIVSLKDSWARMQKSKPATRK